MTGSVEAARLRLGQPRVRGRAGGCRVPAESCLHWGWLRVFRACVSYRNKGMRMFLGFRNRTVGSVLAAILILDNRK